MFFSVPLITFKSIADDGVEHEVNVYIENGHLNEFSAPVADSRLTITSETFVTDTDDPRAFVQGPGDKQLPAEDIPADPLPANALLLIAGLRAFELYREFEEGYVRLARHFKKPNSNKSDDDSHDSSEGVPA